MSIFYSQKKKMKQLRLGRAWGHVVLESVTRCDPLWILNTLVYHKNEHSYAINVSMLKNVARCEVTWSIIGR